MACLIQPLQKVGYQVENISYPSTKKTVEALTEEVRQKVLQAGAEATKIHFVTHSLGGIILRKIQDTHPLPHIGRAVMLAPPNQGSEIVDRIGDWWAFKKINGPAGQQLGTDSKSIPLQLSPVNFSCGVLTGDRSINWINSTMIPGPNDGKVSTKSAVVEGMADYRVLHATHPMIMRKRETQREIVHFLKHGRFS